MNKVLLALKSRTVWTVVALVLINGIPAVRGFIPAQYLPYVDGAIGLLAMYFKVNPSQNYYQ
jgi:hypothetical protein